MNRRQFLKYFVGYGASLSYLKLFAACAQTQTGPPIDPSLLEFVAIIDAHAHPDQFYANRPQRNDRTSTLQKIAEMKMSASSFAAVGDSIYLSKGRFSGSEFERTKEQLSYVQALSEKRKVHIVRQKDDILMKAELRESSPGALLAIEGGDCLEGDPDKLDYFYQLGVRSITLVHYRINEIGDIMTSPPKHLGLTAIGRKVVERMENLGMIIDVAHTHPTTLKDIVQISSKPLIDSHTSLSPVENPSDHESKAIQRMRSWEQMEWVASTGGLICTWPLAYELGNWKRKTFKDWAMEILEMKTRLGMEHVGLGTDGGGMIPWLISGYRDIRDLKNLAIAMLEVGLSKDDIAAYLGSNFYRVLKMCVG